MRLPFLFISVVYVYDTERCVGLNISDFSVKIDVTEIGTDRSSGDGAVVCFNVSCIRICVEYIDRAIPEFDISGI